MKKILSLRVVSVLCILLVLISTPGVIRVGTAKADSTSPASFAVHRYYSTTADRHYEAVAGVLNTLFQDQGTQGFFFRNNVHPNNAILLYTCDNFLNGNTVGGNFVSQSVCPTGITSQTLGYVFATPPGGVGVVPLYVCPIGNDRMLSQDVNCEGKGVQGGLVGYTPQTPATTYTCDGGSSGTLTADQLSTIMHADANNGGSPQEQTALQANPCSAIQLDDTLVASAGDLPGGAATEAQEIAAERSAGILWGPTYVGNLKLYVTNPHRGYAGPKVQDTVHVNFRVDKLSGRKYKATANFHISKYSTTGKNVCLYVWESKRDKVTYDACTDDFTSAGTQAINEAYNFLRTILPDADFVASAALTALVITSVTAVAVAL